MIVKALKVSLRREGLKFKWAYPSWDSPQYQGEFSGYIPRNEDLMYKKVVKKIYDDDDRMKVLYYEVEELLKLI
jgi:hypothetical protein